MRHEIPRDTVIGVVKQDLHIIPSGPKPYPLILLRSSETCSIEPTHKSRIFHSVPEIQDSVKTNPSKFRRRFQEVNCKTEN